MRKIEHRVGVGTIAKVVAMLMGRPEFEYSSLYK